MKSTFTMLELEPVPELGLGLERTSRKIIGPISLRLIGTASERLNQYAWGSISCSFHRSIPGCNIRYQMYTFRPLSCTLVG